VETGTAARHPRVPSELGQISVEAQEGERAVSPWKQGAAQKTRQWNNTLKVATSERLDPERDPGNGSVTEGWLPIVRWGVRACAGAPANEQES